jgi:hypothetical protein
MTMAMVTRMAREKGREKVRSDGSYYKMRGAPESNIVWEEANVKRYPNK